MINFKKLWSIIKELLVVKEIILGLGLASIGISILSRIFNLGMFVSNYARLHSQLFINFGFGLTILYLGLYSIKLRKKMFLGFRANLKEDLNLNWDITKIEGEDSEWIVEDNELSVKGSHYGGITKKGLFWEDYDFEFETKIINKQTAWIVRAKSPFEYLMFQCNAKAIVPHRLYIEDVKVKQGEKEVIERRLQWKITKDAIPLPKSLKIEKNQWFKVKTSLKGHSVKIYINGIEVYHNRHPDMSLYGRVGFRNSGDEHAHFKNIKVVIR